MNMAGLTFIDASCARMIVNAARSLATSRKVVLRCHAGIVARFVLLGAADLPGVTLVPVHER
jgi:anti-anti-sigma regulatory factor